MDIKSTLDAVKAEVHERFPNAGARLEQFDSHLGTLQMIVEHLDDEAVRHGAEGS